VRHTRQQSEICLKSRRARILHEIRELSGDSAIRFKSLAASSVEWLQSKEVTLCEGTFVRYRGFVNEFVANVGKQRAGASVEAITAQNVKAFRDLQVKMVNQRQRPISR
jgi:hypothetical protein